MKTTVTFYFSYMSISGVVRLKLPVAVHEGTAHYTHYTEAQVSDGFYNHSLDIYLEKDLMIERSLSSQVH
jgi:hypothetical protein